MSEDLFAARIRVQTREDAERLVGQVTATMGALAEVLDHETEHLRAGRLRDGLSQETRKGELAGAYLRGLEACKANAIALARFAPDEVARLRTVHAGFQTSVERNQVVIATARAVSESLVRGLADEMSRAAHPEVYGATRQLAPPPRKTAPLVYSRLY